MITMIFYFKPIKNQKKMKLLELFAGSRSIGNEAEKQGFDVF